MRGWRDFIEFVETVLCSPSQDNKLSLIWRGQRDVKWRLETSLDRLLRDIGVLRRGVYMELPSLRSIDYVLRDHGPLQHVDHEMLEAFSRRIVAGFEHAARGRRGVNPKHLSTNEWWALGQHNGLATPLLDWTRSPFAALYFAFEEPYSRRVRTKDDTYRVVFAIDERQIEMRNELLAVAPDVTGSASTLAVIDLLADDNPRLVSQGGVHTRGPVGVSIEEWVRSNFQGSAEPVLTRIEIPNSDRVQCLRGLDRMNINHLSLFPDLSGAARCVNLRTELLARRLS